MKKNENPLPLNLVFQIHLDNLWAKWGLFFLLNFVVPCWMSCRGKCEIFQVTVTVVSFALISQRKKRKYWLEGNLWFPPLSRHIKIYLQQLQVLTVSAQWARYLKDLMKLIFIKSNLNKLKLFLKLFLGKNFKTNRKTVIIHFLFSVPSYLAQRPPEIAQNSPVADLAFFPNNHPLSSWEHKKYVLW